MQPTCAASVSRAWTPTRWSLATAVTPVPLDDDAKTGGLTDSGDVEPEAAVTDGQLASMMAARCAFDEDASWRGVRR